MCGYLRSGEIDIAVILTEGIIKEIINRNPSKIVHVFVERPLIWGIHVKHDFKGDTVDTLQDKRIAISRYGSGSQLMAIVNAFNQGWNVDELKYKVVHGLDGGIQAITNNEADYFMWELFTTKPYVDAVIFKRIGTCPTPWPYFVIVVRNEILENHPEAISSVLSTINQYTTGFK